MPRQRAGIGPRSRGSPASPVIIPSITAATVRALEYVLAGSSKFHSTYVVGAEVATQYGRTGTPGTPGTLSRTAFPDEAAAPKEAADRQVASKLAEGYNEVAALLDVIESPFDPAAGFDAESVRANMSSLLGLPHWMREAASAADFGPMMLRRAGIDEPPRPRRAR